MYSNVIVIMAYVVCVSDSKIAQGLPNGSTFTSSATFFGVVNEAALGPRRGQPGEIFARVVAQSVLNGGTGARSAAHAGQPHHFRSAVFQAVGTIGIA